MRYRIALTSAIAVVALGALGALAGPGWNPVPMTRTIDVVRADTSVAALPTADPVGTYDVLTSVVTVQLTGATVQAQISEPVGATGCGRRRLRARGRHRSLPGRLRHPGP